MVVRENGKQGGFHDRERGRGRVKRGRTSWREKRGGGGSTAAGSARGDRHRRRIHLRRADAVPPPTPLRGCRLRGRRERERGRDDRRRLHRTRAAGASRQKESHRLAWEGATAASRREAARSVGKGCRRHAPWEGAPATASVGKGAAPPRLMPQAGQKGGEGKEAPWWERRRGGESGDGRSGATGGEEKRRGEGRGGCPGDRRRGGLGFS